MKAVVLSRHGGPDKLELRDVPLPEPKHGEVRVRIRVIGVNFAEVLSRRGVYGWAPPLPYIPGMEAFGEIDAVGDGVTGRRPGEKVIVGAKYGTYAEFICVAAQQALPAPARFSPEECAAFVVTYTTAWIGLMEMARLRTTDTVLVTSAAGGVGTAAVQIASKFGARVIGAAGRGKQDAVRAEGAAVALDYDDAQWVDELRRATGGRGVDVALEMRGGDVYRNVVRNLAPMGRVVLAGASSAFPKSRNPLARLRAARDLPLFPLFDMIRRSYGLMCFHVGWLLESGATREQWHELTSFVDQHALTPRVGRSFPLDRIADAHRELEERRNVGKVVVIV